jgi:hypothetical protein
MRWILAAMTATVAGSLSAGESAQDRNHRMYFTTTADFKTFSKTALLVQ